MPCTHIVQSMSAREACTSRALPHQPFRLVASCASKSSERGRQRRQRTPRASRTGRQQSPNAPPLAASEAIGRTGSFSMFASGMDGHQFQYSTAQATLTIGSMRFVEGVDWACRQLHVTSAATSRSRLCATSFLVQISRPSRFCLVKRQWSDQQSRRAACEPSANPAFFVGESLILFAGDPGQKSCTVSL